MKGKGQKKEGKVEGIKERKNARKEIQQETKKGEK